MKLDLEPEGLGYRAYIPDEGIGIAIDRLNESHGDLVGELTVARAPEGHVLRTRFNLSSITTRASTAKLLQQRSPVSPDGHDWLSLLEAFCLEVLRRERIGEAVTTIGDRPPRGRPEFVIDPILLGGNMRTILYGEGGAGKSTLAAAIAVSVASGTPALAGWTVPHPRPVLVLDWETSAEDWNDAIACVASGIGIPAPAIDYWPCSSSVPTMLHELAREVTGREIGLLIIDSVGLAMPGTREGSSAEEGALRLFKALRVLGVPSLLIDHKAKGDSEGPYGSVYKWNSARAVFELRVGGDSDEGDGRHMALIHRKANLTGRLKPVGIRMVRSDDEILLIREDIAEDERLTGGLTVAQRIERVLLRSKPMTVRDLADAIGAGPKVTAVMLSRSDRFVRVGKDGKADLWHVNSNMLENVAPTVGATGILQQVQQRVGVLRTPPPRGGDSVLDVVEGMPGSTDYDGPVYPGR